MQPLEHDKENFATCRNVAKGAQECLPLAVLQLSSNSANSLTSLECTAKHRPKWHLHFVVVELPARRLLCAGIQLTSEACLLSCSIQSIHGLRHSLLVRLFLDDGDYDHLKAGKLDKAASHNSFTSKFIQLRIHTPRCSYAPCAAGYTQMTNSSMGACQHRSNLSTWVTRR